MEKENQRNRSYQLLEENYYQDSDQVKSLKYFYQQLKDFMSVHNETAIMREELEEFMNNLTSNIYKYINNIYGNELLLYKSEMTDIICDMQKEINTYANKDKPILIDKKPYYEKATTKLISIFNKINTPYTNEEAKKIYSDINLITKKYKIFIELIDWVNQNGLSVCPDRIMFCAFLGITIETYQEFLIYHQNEKIKNIFKSIENYIITLKLNAGEIGTRNSGAIKTNVSYDKVGNNLSPKDSGQTINKNIILTNEDIYNKMRLMGFNNNFEQRKKDSNTNDFQEVEFIDYTNIK